jgi:hypothetical protein
MASPFAFAWDVNTPSLSNIEPMWTANMNGDPTTRGTQAAEGLAAKSAGRRCLLLFNVAENAGTDCPLVRDGVTWRRLIAEGYECSRWQDRMRVFWLAYKAANGPRPDMITADWEEAGVDDTVADLETEWPDILAVPAIKALLPRSIQAVDAEDIAGATYPNHPFAWAQIALDQNVYARINEALRLIVVETWEQVFQTVCPPFSNYITTHVRTSPTYTLFGWPRTWSSTVNGYSSPEWYLESERSGTWASFQPGFDAFKARWVNACRCINECRRLTGPVFPWVGTFLFRGLDTNPVPTNDAGDRHFFRHLCKHGVGTWQLFNAGVTDVTSLNEFMATLTVNPDGNVFRPVDPIEQINSGVLTSGDLVTTYNVSEWS